MKRLMLALVLFLGLVLNIHAADIARIGVILPLTGNLANVGEDVRDAMELAMSRYPEVTKSVELIFEDDQSLPKSASLAARKLVEVDKVDALISFYGYGGYAVSAVAEQTHTLHWGLTLDRKVAKGPYSYANFPSSLSGARLMRKVLVALGYTDVTIVYVQSQGPIDQMTALKGQLEEAGIKVRTQNMMSEERDLRPTIAKLSKTPSQLWITINHPPQGDIILRQSKELGVSTPITSFWGFDAVADRSLIEGKWYARTCLPSESFSELFEETYGRTMLPVGLYGHDAVKILAEAFTEAEGDATAAKAYLDGLTEATGEGGHYQVDETGFFDSEWIVARVQDGVTREISLEDIEK